jgi:hypothetical protein
MSQLQWYRHIIIASPQTMYKIEGVDMTMGELIMLGDKLGIDMSIDRDGHELVKLINERLDSITNAERPFVPSLDSGGGDYVNVNEHGVSPTTGLDNYKGETYS